MKNNKDRIKRQPKWAQKLIADQQSAITQLRLLIESLDTPKEVPPDVLPPDKGYPFETIAEGWYAVYIGSGYGKPFCIEPAQTGSHSHYIGESKQCASWSKGSRSLYSTKKLALESLKYEAWLSYREHLCRIEDAIERLGGGKRMNPLPKLNKHWPALDWVEVWESELIGSCPSGRVCATKRYLSDSSNETQWEIEIELGSPDLEVSAPTLDAAIEKAKELMGAYRPLFPC